MIPAYVLILLFSVTIKAFIIFDREIVLHKFNIILYILVMQYYFGYFLSFYLY